ncbi:DUF58 domain-containing protein [Salinispirillum sp. LH 10-3-1]|uniref:DUF58 domain-containing protein n=1 Tax=Salinispirillum sp. LH 10-3-1 TaxID=2952525 RepID=A0AB38YCP3_9GAMM
MFIAFLQQYIETSIQRRTPAARQVKLGQRQIFIMPNRYGLSFLALVLLIFVLGTNYQNNLMLAFAFWLAAIFVLSILMTFQNLSGVLLRAGVSGRDFVGQRIEHHWSVEGQHTHYGVRVLNADEVTFLERVGPSFVGEVVTGVIYQRRGRHAAPRLRVETRFPFGWVTAWTWFQPDQQAIVWPLPIDHQAIPSVESGDGETSALQRPPGSADLDHSRPYQVGDAPRRVLWRHYARRGVMMVKTAPPEGVTTQAFSLQQVEHLPIERGLEQLSFWMTEALTADQAWSLQLGNEIIPLSSGVEHLHNCLSRLAIMGEQDDV